MTIDNFSVLPYLFVCLKWVWLSWGILAMCFVECPSYFSHERTGVMSYGEAYHRDEVSPSSHTRGDMLPTWFISGYVTLISWFNKLGFFFITMKNHNFAIEATHCVLTHTVSSELIKGCEEPTGALHKIRNASRICTSSLRRGRANLLCVVPVLVRVLPKQALKNKCKKKC